MSTNDFSINPFCDPEDIWNHPSPVLFSTKVKWLKLPEAESWNGVFTVVTHSVKLPSADWVSTNNVRSPSEEPTFRF